MHTALEPHAYVATWHGSQRLTVYASTQGVRELRQAIAEHFGLEKQNVQVIAEHIGGAFGAKQGLAEEGVAAISLARASQQAVRVACDRLEELSFTSYRPGAEVALALLTNEQGEMHSLVATSYGDAGIAIGSLVGMQIGFASPPGPRAFSDCDIVNHMPPGKPFRGPCGPQAFWALEQAIDEVAYKLHRDPLELRRCWYSKNPLRLKLLDWATALPAWAQRGPVASTSGRFRRGIGVAAAAWPFTYNASTKVEVSATPDGLLARCATQDGGSGTRTVLAQAVAEVFALPPGDVLVHIGDSSAPLGPGSFASQVTNSVYGPARDAATQVRDHLLEAARTQLRLSNVQAVAGGITHAGGFMSWHMLLQQTKPYTAVLERHAERGPLGIPLRLPGDENSPTPGFRQAHALTLVEVEVDTLLGKIRPLHAWTGIAAGKIFVEVPSFFSLIPYLLRTSRFIHPRSVGSRLFYCVIVL